VAGGLGVALTLMAGMAGVTQAYLPNVIVGVLLLSAAVYVRFVRRETA
jgi:hypothetical protein